MPEPTPPQTGNAIQGIWNSEKGFLTALALVGATVLCAIGRMTIDQWTGFVEVIMVAYIGGKTITTVGTAIAGRAPALPDAGNAAAVTNMVVQPPPAQPSQPPAPTTPTLVVAATGTPTGGV